MSLIYFSEAFTKFWLSNLMSSHCSLLISRSFMFRCYVHLSKRLSNIYFNWVQVTEHKLCLYKVDTNQNLTYAPYGSCSMTLTFLPCIILNHVYICSSLFSPTEFLEGVFYTIEHFLFLDTQFSLYSHFITFRFPLRY